MDSYTPVFKELFEKNKKAGIGTKFIYWSTLSTQIILGGIAIFYLKNSSPVEFKSRFLPYVFIIFTVIAILSLAGSLLFCQWFIFKNSHIDRILAEKIKIESLADAGEGKIDQALLEKLKQLKEPELKIYSAFRRFHSLFFVGHTTAEISAILGFILALLVGNFKTYLYFSIPSLIVMLSNISQVDKLSEKMAEFLEKKLQSLNSSIRV